MARACTHTHTDIQDSCAITTLTASFSKNIDTIHYIQTNFLYCASLLFV